jgi:hypothetical protein
MSRQLRKPLRGALIAPDLGKTDESKSGASGLITGRPSRALSTAITRWANCRDLLNASVLMGDEHPPSYRQCGCRSRVRFRSPRSPSVTLADLADADLFGPAVTERRTTRSTDVAVTIDEVVARPSLTSRKSCSTPAAAPTLKGVKSQPAHPQGVHFRPERESPDVSVGRVTGVVVGRGQRV